MTAEKGAEVKYDFERHEWTGQCPHGDVCSWCDARGFCTRMEPERTPSGASQRESTAGLGYRQKKLLAALRDFGRPMPTGYLVRVLFDTDVLNQVSYKTTSVSLNGLEKRKLARRVRRGLWEAVA